MVNFLESLKQSVCGVVAFFVEFHARLHSGRFPLSLRILRAVNAPWSISFRGSSMFGHLVWLLRVQT